MKIPTWAWAVAAAAGLWYASKNAVTTTTSPGWTKANGPYATELVAFSMATGTVLPGATSPLMTADQGSSWRLTKYADGWWVELKSVFSNGANSGGGTSF